MLVASCEKVCGAMRAMNGSITTPISAVMKIKTIAETAPFAAYKRGASDILIEPQTTDCRIRFTIDG